MGRTLLRRRPNLAARLAACDAANTDWIKLRRSQLVVVADNAQDDLCDIYLSDSQMYRMRFFQHYAGNVTLDCIVASPCPFLSNKWARFSFACGMLGVAGLLVCVIFPWIGANMRYFWSKGRPLIKADQVSPAIASPLFILSSSPSALHLSVSAVRPRPRLRSSPARACS